MRWFRKSRKKKAIPEERGVSDAGYAYRIHWAQAALSWPHARRLAVLAELEDLLSGEDFVANPYRRRYRMETLEGRAFAGESLRVLHAVIRELEAREASQEDQDE